MKGEEAGNQSRSYLSTLRPCMLQAPAPRSERLCGTRTTQHGNTSTNLGDGAEEEEKEEEEEKGEEEKKED